MTRDIEYQRYFRKIPKFTHVAVTCLDILDVRWLGRCCPSVTYIMLKDTDACSRAVSRTASAQIASTEALGIGRNLHEHVPRNRVDRRQ